MKRILVPVDRSESTERVLNWVENLAAWMALEVSFVHVVDAQPNLGAAESGSPATPQCGAAVPEADETSGAVNYLSGLASGWRAKGFNALWAVVQDTPANAVVEFALSRKIDAIALSPCSRPELMHRVLGASAEGLLTGTDAPVLLVGLSTAVAHAWSRPGPVGSPDRDERLRSRCRPRFGDAEPTIGFGCRIRVMGEEQTHVRKGVGIQAEPGGTPPARRGRSHRSVASAGSAAARLARVEPQR